MANSKTIVASVAPNHPNGQRVRAGILFTTEALEYEVTAEQLKEIKADEYIVIHDGKKGKDPVNVVDDPELDGSEGTNVGSDAQNAAPKTDETSTPATTPEASKPDDVPPADTQAPVDPKAPATPAPAKK